MPALFSSPFSCAVSCFGWFTPGILNSSNFTTSASCSPFPSHSHKSFIPLLNRAYLLLSRLFSTCSQLSLPTMSSAKIIAHGDYSRTSSFNPFISTANKKIIIPVIFQGPAFEPGHKGSLGNFKLSSIGWMKEHIRLAAARLLVSTDILSAPPTPTPRPPRWSHYMLNRTKRLIVS